MRTHRDNKSPGEQKCMELEDFKVEGESLAPHLHIIGVDDGAGDVGQQLDELVLEEAHILGDVVDHDLDALVVLQDVDAHDGHVAVARLVAGQHLQLEIAGVVRPEQVVGSDNACVV